MSESDSKLGARVSRFVVNRPYLALLIGLTTTGALWAGFPRIAANFTHTAFFFEDDPLLQRFNRFERQFGNDDAVTVVVKSPSGIFDKESSELIRSLTEEMWKIPEVIQVESVANFSWVHAEGDEIVVEPLLPDIGPLDREILEERRTVALEHELLPDYLVSKDGTIGLVFGRIKPGIDAPPNTETIVTATRELVDKYRTGDHEFHITGGPAVNFAFQEISKRDLGTLVPVVMLMVVVFLALSFRAVGGVLLPLVVIVTGVSAAFALAGWLQVEINSVTTILPQILIAIGVADSVHVLTSFYRAKRRGMDKKSAAIHALTKNFVPTLLTSISTAIGFFAFSSANLKPISGLGILAGIGTLYAWYITYFLMGPLMRLGPSFVKPKSDGQDLDAPSAFGWKMTDLVHRYRYPIVGFYAVGCIAAVILATQIRINADPYKYFAVGYPLRDAQDFVLANLGGVPSFETMIDSGREDGIKDPEFLAKVEVLEADVVASVDGINRSVSIVDILRQTHRSLNGGSDAFYTLAKDKDTIAQEKFLYEMSLPQGRDINNQVTIKNDALRISFISTISDSARWTRVARDIEDRAQELGLDAQVTGKSMLYQSMNGYVVESFITSLTIAIVLISTLLVVFFRSLRTGGIALLPNLIPLLIGGAALRLLGVDLDIGTVLVSSVCLGIAVDDTIHIMANFNRYQKEGRDVRESIAMIVTNTGPALITTTLVLVFGFGTLAFATFVPNVYFGVMTAVVLLTALITDLTFLPALMMLFPPSGTVDNVSVDTPTTVTAAG